MTDCFICGKDIWNEHSETQALKCLAALSIMCHDRTTHTSELMDK